MGEPGVVCGELLQTFVLACAAGRWKPPSFPTRRSSDLLTPAGVTGRDGDGAPRDTELLGDEPHQLRVGRTVHRRSEEHTSELQSLTKLVCRLLLEKKNELQQTAGHAGATESWKAAHHWA